jgi:hypothetical protein
VSREAVFSSEAMISIYKSIQLTTQKTNIEIVTAERTPNSIYLYGGSNDV